MAMPDGKAPHFPQQPVARQNDDGSLELECFLEANPTPDIKWYYEQNEVKSGERFLSTLNNKGGDAFSAILKIKELADSDAGSYRCAIVNPYGKGNANFNLKLTGFSCTAKNDSGKLTATFSVKFEVPQGALNFTRQPQILQFMQSKRDL